MENWHDAKRRHSRSRYESAYGHICLACVEVDGMGAGWLLASLAFVAVACAVDTCSKSDCPKMSNTERTFIAVKPDGVHRGLVGKIIARFEERGFKLVALKQLTASKAHLEVHYQDLKDKPFFPSLIEYMSSGPIVAMVWQGLDVVKQGRVMLGATNPLASAPGTIRGDFAIQTGRNICHGSDAVDSANREIAHWFKQEEINDYASPFINSWVYE